MIGRLRGTIVTDPEDSTVVVDVHGVGYEVHMPMGSAGRISFEADGTQVVHIHTVFRQDAFELFGFATTVERTCFRSLISVPNVGPKTAMGILSFLAPAELSSAIEAGDIAKLAKAPGIGKRTAERMVVELKGKLGAMSSTAISAAKKPVVQGGNGDRLNAALTNMGYRPVEAARAVELLGEKVTTLPLPELLREALAILTR